jgi:tetratricopeptide (TPR) repeat protein
MDIHPESSLPKIDRRSGTVTAPLGQPNRRKRFYRALTFLAVTAVFGSALVWYFSASPALVEVDPYMRGLKHLADKQYDLAIQEFDRAIGRGDSKSYFVRGQAWLQKQNYDQAIADFAEALKTESGNYFLYMNRAAAYAHKGDGASAITDYRRALALDPDESTKKQISVALKNLNAKR